MTGHMVRVPDTEPLPTVAPAAAPGGATAAPAAPDGPAARRRRIAVAGTCLAVAALSFTLGAVRADHVDHVDHDRPSTRPSLATASPAAPGRPSMTAGTSGLGTVHWQTVAGLQLPVSTAAGPHVVTATTASGFARSDAGAAFAAVHILARCFPNVGADVFEQAISGQVYGKDAALLAAVTELAYDDYAAAAGIDDDEIPSDAGRLLGYRVGPTADQGTRLVDVLFRRPDAAGGGLVGFALRVRWIDGDWRLEAPANGDWRVLASIVATPDLTRFRSFDTGAPLGAQPTRVQPTRVQPTRVQRSAGATV